MAARSRYRRISIAKVENSYVTLPELPGIGCEGKADLFREMQALPA